MPELPEVETVRVQLIDKIVGKTIKAVEVFHQKTVGEDEDLEDSLIGKKLENIDRVGKLMIFSFVGQADLFLLAHLKMTGQFFFVDKQGELSGGGHSMSEADIRELPGRHTRVAFYFTDGSTLYFNDMRIFGYVRRTNRKGVEKAKAGFGPEPIDPNFDVDSFTKQLRKRKISVKAALLDQSKVAGLGNIYVDEALYRAGVRPTRRADRVSGKEAAAIAAASRDVMNESIKVGGTTFQHFADAEGKKGNFTRFLRVFGKQGTPCPRCGTEIKKIRVGGRGTHYCPKCQK